MYNFVYIELKCNTLQMFYDYFESWTTMSDVAFPKFGNVFFVWYHHYHSLL